MAELSMTDSLPTKHATCWNCRYVLGAGDYVTLCHDIDDETVERRTYAIPAGCPIAAPRCPSDGKTARLCVSGRLCACRASQAAATSTSDGQLTHSPGVSNAAASP